MDTTKRSSTRRRCSSSSLADAHSPTTAHVKAYVKRLSFKQINVYPDWNIKKPLPRLPVPELEKTMKMYLKTLRPISTSEEHNRVSILVDKFLSTGEGAKLQGMLQTRAAEEANWAYNWWLEDMYLLNQLPLPINSNPGMVFPKTSFQHPDDQLKVAARLVSGILDYKVIIDARGLPIDRARHREKGQPLCMEQYYRLFSTYREPGLVKDTLETKANDINEAEHIVVMCKNEMYQLNVVHGFHRLTEDNICCQLRRIRSMARDNPVDSGGLGILTTLPRNEWAEARSKLIEDETNKESLRLIETSIFILCLDRPVGNEPRDDKSQALQMLHGHGSHVNSCNRWYDKTMQFVIGEDGACGLNYEHSPSEGIAVVQLIEHVLKYMEELRQRKLVRMDSIRSLPYPSKLEWNLSLPIIQHTDMARFQMDRAIADLDLYLLKFDKFGKEFPKSQNMSPDCFIQLAFQLTYYRLNGQLVSTYESASTRRFHLGRVDNIRAASTEALEWCKSMATKNLNIEKLKLLREAMQAQTDTMVQTILGFGMDCHMLGLKRIAEQKLGVTPELFQNALWTSCNKFVLSTSQVNTSLDSFMGYGPVVKNGYGTSYNPQPDRIIFCITSFKSFTKTDSQTFGETLQQVLVDMHDICLSQHPSLTRNVSTPLHTIEEKGHKVNDQN
ncbi:choline O-acetyltransferase-like [Watersipora subatra]|uniref:choline O-acetyltransferase-like n=1 Tax=Watersipora subatra TaxID=2589382 RepID=UPI00355B8DA5